MSEKETGGAALWGEASLTPRVYAAIHLCIPDSGIDWLDEMIAKAEKRDVAAKAMQAIYEDCRIQLKLKVKRACEIVDAMIKERDRW